MKKNIHWKLNLGTMSLLFFWQLITLISTTRIFLTVSRSCITTPGYLMWQCSGNSNPSSWSYGTMLIVPPLVVKLLFNWLKIPISWKRLIVLQFIIYVFLLFSAFLYANYGGPFDSFN